MNQEERKEVVARLADHCLTETKLGDLISDFYRKTTNELEEISDKTLLELWKSKFGEIYVPKSV